MFKVFLAAALAVGAGGLTYAAADVATASEGTETAVTSEGGKGGPKGGPKGKGGKGGKKGGPKGKGGKGPGKHTEEQ